MLRRFFCLMTVLLGLFPLQAQENDENLPNLFSEPLSSPIIARSNDRRDPWREQFTDPGAVTYHDGKFHMFRNRFVGWPAPVWVNYMVSEDGINWSEPQSEPVFLTEQVPFAEVAALPSSVHVEADGTWVMYFYTWNQGLSGSSAIGRATADNPLGTWTVDAEPVLQRGAAGAWDEGSLTAPLVIRRENGYLMYYAGSSENQAGAIGLATSRDGIHWEKYAENPILSADLDWENGTVHQPRVIQNGDEWLMIYRAVAAQGDRTSMRLGLASSADGVNWEKATTNPIVAPTVVETGLSIWYHSALSHAGTAYLYLEIMPRSNTTDIFVVTAPLAELNAAK